MSKYLGIFTQIRSHLNRYFCVKMPKYFDIHSHLNSSAYQKDFDEVIKRLKETETHTMVVGTDFESSKKAVDLADKYEEIYACIGIHPVDNPSRSFEREKFEKLVKHPKTVAIGECGMDFFHADKNIDYDRQKKLFLDQVKFALVHNKPIMIHARNANVEVAKRFFEIGFTVSFTGVITFVRDYDEVIKSTPLNMIMSETDSPYVTPTPYRGKRNEPSYVSEVVKKIAEIREENDKIVGDTLVSNALSMIG